MRIKKSSKANLESKRSIFLQIGFVLSLSFVLLAFEWTTVETDKFDWDFDRGTLIDDEISEITIIKEKPEVKKTKIITPIFVPDDEDIPDDDLDINAEVDETTENSLDNRQEFTNEEIETEDNNIYEFVQIRPQFPGGEAALYAFLAKNLKYPRLAKEINLTGTVHASFIVWKDGTIKDVKILRSIGSGCDEEVIRVLNMMPKWNPGMQGGKKVNVSFHMPVVFNLH
ncbi:MAG: energy transducer TonB [Chlorobi bacterium]|nr:energy transducer TonB [Chlorobiota bacterium]